MNKEVSRQLDVLLPGLAELISEEELARKLERSLRSGVPLRVKYGADPSAPDLHLGHSIPLEKLRRYYWAAMGFDPQTGQPTPQCLASLNITP